MDNTQASQAVGKPRTAAAAAASASLDMCCPRCSRADQVGKVSGLYAASRTRTTITVEHQSITGAWGTARGTATTTTHLRQRLAPPRLPAWYLLPGAAAAFLAVALVCSLGLVAGDNGSPSALAGEVMVIMLMAIGFAGAVALTAFGRRKWKADVPSFQQRLANWHRLFYCRRCATSFVPPVYCAELH